MKKLLISAVLSTAILISGSLSAKTLKFQISSKAGDWAHTYLNTKNKVLEELTNGELKIDPLPTKSVVPHRETIDAVANGIHKINNRFKDYLIYDNSFQEIECIYVS